MFLMIQNPGVAPIEAFTLLGVSTTAYDALDPGPDNDFDILIGQFGSGNKHAVNLLLRNNIPPVVFCGKLRLEFYTKTGTMDDGLTSKNYGQIHCKISGKDTEGKSVNRDKDLGFVLEYGERDWVDLAMAMREFISNSIDRTIRQEKRFAPALKEGRLSVEVVADNQVRAKDGFTRVFIPFTPEVQQFYSELPKRFLHFSEPELLRTIILPKRDRNLSKHRKPMVYRKGVFVREVESSEYPSLFDYNFSNQLRIDEARNVDDWQVKDAATAAIREANKTIIAKVFQSLIDRQASWEATFDKYALSLDRIYHEERREKAKANWREGWNQAADGAVLVEDFGQGPGPLAERVSKKGFKIAAIHHNGWSAAAADNEVKTAYKVLSKHESKGIDILSAPTPFAVEAVNRVWSWIEEVGLSGGKEKPSVKSFRLLPDAESETLGFYEDGVVHINEVHSNDGCSKRLLQTALDELTHHVTGSTDNSRDFQSFLMRMIVEKFVC